MYSSFLFRGRFEPLDRLSISWRFIVEQRIKFQCKNTILVLENLKVGKGWNLIGGTRFKWNVNSNCPSDRCPGHPPHRNRMPSFREEFVFDKGVSIEGETRFLQTSSVFSSHRGRRLLCTSCSEMRLPISARCSWPFQLTRMDFLLTQSPDEHFHVTISVKVAGNIQDVSTRGRVIDLPPCSSFLAGCRFSILQGRRKPFLHPELEDTSGC